MVGTSIALKDNKMDIKAYSLEQVTKWVVGYELFEKIKIMVSKYLLDNGKTGEEKRNAVLTELQEISSDFVGVIVNLAVEVAVYLLKRKLGI